MADRAHFAKWRRNAMDYVQCDPSGVTFAEAYFAKAVLVLLDEVEWLAFDREGLLIERTVEEKS